MISGHPSVEGRWNRWPSRWGARNPRGSAPAARKGPHGWGPGQAALVWPYGEGQKLKLGNRIRWKKKFAFGTERGVGCSWHLRQRGGGQ